MGKDKSLKMSVMECMVSRPDEDGELAHAVEEIVFLDREPDPAEIYSFIFDAFMTLPRDEVLGGATIEAIFGYSKGKDVLFKQIVRHSDTRLRKLTEEGVVFEEALRDVIENPVDTNRVVALMEAIEPAETVKSVWSKDVVTRG